MEKITTEEFRSTALHGAGRSSRFYNELLKLKPGEGLTILKKEWQATYPPTRLANKIARRFGYEFEKGALPARDGWSVLRVK